MGWFWSKETKPEIVSEWAEKGFKIHGTEGAREIDKQTKHVYSRRRKLLITGAIVASVALVVTILLVVWLVVAPQLTTQSLNSAVFDFSSMQIGFNSTTGQPLISATMVTTGWKGSFTAEGVKIKVATGNRGMTDNLDDGQVYFTLPTFDVGGDDSIAEQTPYVTNLTNLELNELTDGGHADILNYCVRMLSTLGDQPFIGLPLTLRAEVDVKRTTLGITRTHHLSRNWYFSLIPVPISDMHMNNVTSGGENDELMGDFNFEAYPGGFVIETPPNMTIYNSDKTYITVQDSFTFGGPNSANVVQQGTSLGIIDGVTGTEAGDIIDAILTARDSVTKDSSPVSYDTIASDSYQYQIDYRNVFYVANEPDTSGLFPKDIGVPVDMDLNTQLVYVVTVAQNNDTITYDLPDAYLTPSSQSTSSIIYSDGTQRTVCTGEDLRIPLDPSSELQTVSSGNSTSMVTVDTETTDTTDCPSVLYYASLCSGIPMDLVIARGSILLGTSSYPIADQVLPFNLDIAATVKTEVDNTYGCGNFTIS
eukprot:Clim_evm60s142 gene=Clim_evmTU60s142